MFCARVLFAINKIAHNLKVLLIVLPVDRECHGGISWYTTEKRRNLMVNVDKFEY